MYAITQNDSLPRLLCARLLHHRHLLICICGQQETCASMAAASRQGLKRIMSPCKQTCSLLFLFFPKNDSTG